MAFENDVTKMAQEIYPQIFKDTSAFPISESEKIHIGDTCAVMMCQTWQDRVIESSSCEMVKEATVAGNNPIDLVDLTHNIAYELKYSHKNVKQEFYKDLFKVLVYNEEVNPEDRLKTFVFLCHYKGISSLFNSNLCKSTIKFMAKQGITVELVELFPEEIPDFQAA